ncbi:hypothetical protein OPV22_003249 [Ensete ventricosum]|uniref:Uncharacterized protein n=1 Tax=Ensete ventricosum TaxID=4639 RepID=A0AAV8S0F1_ENSVE|nr:hypothetical protein OPV22_003249 [Ensete ventricosum]
MECGFTFLRGCGLEDAFLHVACRAIDRPSLLQMLAQEAIVLSEDHIMAHHSLLEELKFEEASVVAT